MNTPNFLQKTLLFVIGLQCFYLDPTAALPCALLVFRCADAPRKVRLHSVSLRMTPTVVIKNVKNKKIALAKKQEGDGSRYHLCSPIKRPHTAQICRSRITGDTVTAYLPRGFRGATRKGIRQAPFTVLHQPTALCAKENCLLFLVYVFTYIV